MSDEMKKAALASLMGITKAEKPKAEKVEPSVPVAPKPKPQSPKLTAPKAKTTSPKPKEDVPQFEPVSNFISPYYKGKGVYERKDGQSYKKIGIHIRPDQYKALQMAKATGEDARGNTIEEIIRTLLDEAGFRA